MKPKALIIDDNQMDLLFAKVNLESLGFECRVADSGDSALKYLTKEEFAIVLLDLQMPVMGGFQFLLGAKTSQILNDFPIVIMSGRNDQNIKNLCKQFGAEDFINKPIDLNRDREKFIKYLGGNHEVRIGSR